MESVCWVGMRSETTPMYEFGSRNGVRFVQDANALISNLVAWCVWANGLCLHAASTINNYI